MARGDYGCEYPRCGGGRCVGKRFCPKHIKTPFETIEEVNAYRRGQRDGRAEVIKAADALRASLADQVSRPDPVKP